jgi:hypothetical protein
MMGSCVTHEAMTSAEKEIGVIIRQMGESIESNTIDSQQNGSGEG